MQLQRLGNQPEPEAIIQSIEVTGGHGVRIQVGDRTHVIVTRKADATGFMRSESLETDGQVATVDIAPDGTVLDAMAIGARKLRYNGRTLLDSEKSCNWSTDRVR